MKQRKKRAYDMRNRAANAAATRQLVALSARRLFQDRWYEEVSLQDVAQEAGVSLATVTRFFPLKSKLLLASIFADKPRTPSTDWRPGDIAGAIDLLVDSYEDTGMWMVRHYATALRVPELQPIVAQTRAMTRGWIAQVCAPRLPRRGAGRERVLDALDAALDVRTWWTLRRDMLRSVPQTRAHLRFVVEAILEAGNRQTR
jgi:AcrR family transcriptional regulator